jgi:hypothetical protein
VHEEQLLSFQQVDIRMVGGVAFGGCFGALPPYLREVSFEFISMNDGL